MGAFFIVIPNHRIHDGSSHANPFKVGTWQEADIFVETGTVVGLLRLVT